MVMMVDRANGAFRHPRRHCVDQYIPLEKAIAVVIYDVEELESHPRLTDAVVALQSAKDAIADWAEETGNILPQ